MKNKRNVKIFLVCLLIGLGVGWWYMRDRPGDDERVAQDDIAVADDPEGDEDSDADELLGNDTGETSGVLAVDFADDVDPAYVAALGERLHLKFEPASSYVDHDRLYLARVAPDQQAGDLAELRHDPKVEAADLDVQYGIPENALRADEQGLLDKNPEKPGKGKLVPNDPRYSEQWHMRQLHMEETWPAAAGEGVIVAVIDTGVTKTKDLQQTQFVAGWNFVNNSANTEDDHGHGTHVAGTIAQSTNNGVGVAGVAFKAKIMPMKVLSAQGSGSVSGIAEAIRWASDHGAKVINMSLGGRMSSSVLAKAVKYAHDHGTVVVCAAGNDGKGKVSFPAAYPGAIAVAATQKDEATTFYSNWGKEIDVAAPGGNTRNDPTGGVLQNTLYMGKDDYFFFMGTSMASPHVAGVAALIVGSGITDPDAVEKVLKDTARTPASMKNKPADYAQHYGAGLVDAQAAVRKAQLESGGVELGVAALLTGLVVWSLRRRQLLGFFGIGGVLGAVFASSGLFFLPQLGLGQFFGSSLVTHGFPGWDAAALGAAGHGNLLFYSALLPVGLAVALFNRSRFRGLIAGVALGLAGHLLATVLLHQVDIRWISFDRTWLLGNAALCALIGYVSARRD